MAAPLICVLLLLLGVSAGWPLSRGEAQGAGESGRTLSITAFGAVGDGRTDSTAAIKAALREARKGATTVVVPAPGIFLSGPLLINGTQRLTLVIEEGATLRSAGWQHASKGQWPILDDVEWWNHSSRPGRNYAPVLWLLGVNNVIVRGAGTLDGQGSSGWWQSALRPPARGFNSCPEPSCPHCVESCPARPRLLLVQDSSLVTVEGIELKDSPFWTCHLFNSTDIKIQRLRVRNPAGLPHGEQPFVRDWGYGPNADGIDIEHSQRVLVDSCDIQCGDDALCLKAGFGPSPLQATRDALLRNNKIFTSCPHVLTSNNGTPAWAPADGHRNDGCGGIKLGYGTFSGIENVRFEKNHIAFAGVAVKISSHLGMGGPIRNISFVDTEVTRTGIAVNVDLAVLHPQHGGGPTGTQTDPAFLSTVDGISIVNLSARGSIGCYHNTTPGAYCGGAGCLLGSQLVALRNIQMKDVHISAYNGQPVGWACANVTPTVVPHSVVPPTCQQAGMAFGCSET